MSDITFLYVIAERVPGIELSNALGLLEDAKRFLDPKKGEQFDLSTHVGRVGWLRRSEDEIAQTTALLWGRTRRFRQSRRCVTLPTADSRRRRSPWMRCIPSSSLFPRGSVSCFHSVSSKLALRGYPPVGG